MFPKLALRIVTLVLVGATLALLGGRILGDAPETVGRAERADAQARALVVPVEIIEVGEDPALHEVRVER